MNYVMSLKKVSFTFVISPSIFFTLINLYAPNSGIQVFHTYHSQNLVLILGDLKRTYQKCNNMCKNSNEIFLAFIELKITKVAAIKNFSTKTERKIGNAERTWKTGAERKSNTKKKESNESQSFKGYQLNENRDPNGLPKQKTVQGLKNLRKSESSNDQLFKNTEESQTPRENDSIVPAPDVINYAASDVISYAASDVGKWNDAFDETIKSSERNDKIADIEEVNNTSSIHDEEIADVHKEKVTFEFQINKWINK